MPLDQECSSGASTPRSCHPASDIVRTIPLVLTAAHASAFVGANMVEMQAAWGVQRSSGCCDPAYFGRKTPGDRPGGSIACGLMPKLMIAGWIIATFLTATAFELSAIRLFPELFATSGTQAPDAIERLGSSSPTASVAD